MSSTQHVYISARPQETHAYLERRDPDSARYWTERLRAAADLLLAGEPVCLTDAEYIDDETGPGQRKQGVTYIFDEATLRAAEIEVHRRVKDGDEDYVIKVVPKEPSRTLYRKRR